MSRFDPSSRRNGEHAALGLLKCVAAALLAGISAADVLRAGPSRGSRVARSSPEGRLRVGIASSGRFHLLDLARELDALGVDVRFYSYVPRKRAEKFGLPSRCHVALLPILFPMVV